MANHVTMILVIRDTKSYPQLMMCRWDIKWEIRAHSLKSGPSASPKTLIYLTPLNSLLPNNTLCIIINYSCLWYPLIICTNFISFYLLSHDISFYAIISQIHTIGSTIFPVIYIPEPCFIVNMVWFAASNLFFYQVCYVINYLIYFIVNRSMTTEMVQHYGVPVISSFVTTNCVQSITLLLPIYFEECTRLLIAIQDTIIVFSFNYSTYWDSAIDIFHWFKTILSRSCDCLPLSLTMNWIKNIET